MSERVLNYDENTAINNAVWELAGRFDAMEDRYREFLKKYPKFSDKGYGNIIAEILDQLFRKSLYHLETYSDEDAGDDCYRVLIKEACMVGSFFMASEPSDNPYFNCYYAEYGKVLHKIFSLATHPVVYNTTRNGRIRRIYGILVSCIKRINKALVSIVEGR
jgi:hypothetical protein